MSRIAYVNGRYRAARPGKGRCRGSRLSVRRRRLRGLRGEGRPPGRRAPPHGAARALAQRTAHRTADVASRAGRRAARDGAAQPGARRHRLSAGHPRRCAARPSVSAPRHTPVAGRHRAQQSISTVSSRWPPTASRSSPCRTTAGRASTSSRSLCCRTCWPSRRRASRAPARPGSSTRRTRHRRLVVERLDRHPRRQGGHASARRRHPARHHPHGRARHDQAQGLNSRSAPSRSRRPMRRARHSSPRRARSSCRW